MALNRTAIEDALRGLVVTGTGLPDGSVIFANQNAPRPLEPYAVVNARLATRRLGMFDEEVLDADHPGRIERHGLRVLSVSVNVYGPGADELAELAAEYLETYAAGDALEAAGLAYVDRTEVRNPTAMLETGYQARGQFDARFNAVSLSIEDVGWIERVQFDGELVADNGDTLTTDSET